MTFNKKLTPQLSYKLNRVEVIIRPTALVLPLMLWSENKLGMHDLQSAAHHT